MEQALRDRGSYYNKDECPFCPSVFHLQAVNTRNTGLQGPPAGPHACSTSRFSLPGFLRRDYKKYLEIKVEQHNTISADKIFWVKEITAVYLQTFRSSGILSFE